MRIVKGGKGTAGTMVAPAGEFKPRTSGKVRYEFAMNIYAEPAAPATETATDSTAPQAQSWRDTLPIHPAAALFPRMSSDELRELGKDIRKNGLRSSIALWQSDKGASALLLDGISRLDAVEVELGRPVRVVLRTYRSRTRRSLETDEDGESVPVTTLIGEAGNTTAEQQIFILLGRDVDPWAYVISTNLHRRHLTAEQKREIVAALLKANPERSNNATAKIAKVDDKTVGAVRAQLERRSEIPNVSTRTDSKGRKQPARKTKTKPPPLSEEVLQQRAAAAERIRPLMGGQTRDDIGPASNDEIMGKDACIEKLQADKCRLEIENIGLRREVEETKAARQPEGEGEGEGSELGNLLHAWGRASQGAREKFKAHVGLVAVEPPAEATDDGFDIPEYLRRAAP